MEVEKVEGMRDVIWRYYCEGRCIESGYQTNSPGHVIRTCHVVVTYQRSLIIVYIYHLTRFW